MFGSLEEKVDKATKPLTLKIDELQEQIASLKKKQKKLSKLVTKDE